MKIYLATGWNNQHTRSIKDQLERAGHHVYHFLDSGFELDYNKIVPNLHKQDPKLQASLVSHPDVRHAFQSNLDALVKCDVFILAEPCGKGSYMEFGMASASGKSTILIVTAEYTLGVMDSAFRYVVTNPIELAAAVNDVERIRYNANHRTST